MNARPKGLFSVNRAGSRSRAAWSDPALRRQPLGADGSGAPSPRRRLLLPLAVLAFAAALVFWSGSVLAFQTHGLDFSFGTAGSGDSQFDNNAGIDVYNATGDVYVADAANHRVEKFDSAGNFLAAWGWGVSDGSAASQVCTSNCQAGIAGIGNGQFTTPVDVAVDQNNGDVYVADGITDVREPGGGVQGNNLIEKFSSNGTFLSSNNGGASPAGPFQALTSIATDASGNVWAVDLCSTSGSDAFGGTCTEDLPDAWEFDNTGAFVQQWDTSVVWNEAIAADEATNSVYMIRESGAVGRFNYDGTTTTCATTPCSPENISRNPGSDNGRGVSVDAAGRVYFADDVGIAEYPAWSGTANPAPLDEFGNNEISEAGPNGVAANSNSDEVYVSDRAASQVEAFKPGVTFPDTFTDPVGNLTAQAAVLNGHVNPDGVQVTDCHFEYLTQAAFNANPANDRFNGAARSPAIRPRRRSARAARTWRSPPRPPVSSPRPNTTTGSSPRTPTAASRGGESTFTTLGAIGVVADPATDITKHDATLNGKVNPLIPPATQMTRLSLRMAHHGRLQRQSRR